MKRSRYTRLKLNMMLRILLAAAGITGLTAALLRALGGQESVSELYRSLARGLFGLTAEEAERFFYTTLLPNWPVILSTVFVLSVVVGVYLTLGRLTGWFDRIGDETEATRREIDRAVRLPTDLAPLEAELNEVRLDVIRREQKAVEDAARAQELVTYLAHDLKTPLTSVVGYLDLLAARPELTPEERRRYTAVALEKARRLEELIGEFFDINRLDLDSVEKAGQMLDLSMILEQLAEEFWPIFEEKGLTFHRAIGDGLHVWGDPDKLVRVFDNVLRNAVNYSVPHGVVGLRAFRQGGELVITVDNEGLEIPEQELSNIFRKFYRLDAARSTQTGGFGLGLAIAKEIVERHRGTIRAESNGKRVVFTILLPAR